MSEDPQGEWVKYYKSELVKAKAKNTRLSGQLETAKINLANESEKLKVEREKRKAGNAMLE